MQSTYTIIMITGHVLGSVWLQCTELPAWMSSTASSVSAVVAVATVAIIVIAGAGWWTNVQSQRSNDSVVPLSVNFHFTRKCNYTCGFCFHTDTSGFILPLDEQKRGLRMLADAGMKKVNFSGGEPFLMERGERVGQLVKYCKDDLHLESVSIVTNGSLVTEDWFDRYGKFVDILAVSCDSFDPAINAAIGREFRGKDHITSLRNVSEWCHGHGVLFKLNTVVNAHNKDEDMSDGVQSLGSVCRWKIFKVLPIVGENVGDGAKRNVDTFLVTDDEFNEFVNRHRRAGLAGVCL